jgi:hypothetical protein
LIAQSIHRQTPAILQCFRTRFIRFAVASFASSPVPLPYLLRPFVVSGSIVLQSTHPFNTATGRSRTTGLANFKADMA